MRRSICTAHFALLTRMTAAALAICFLATNSVFAYSFETNQYTSRSLPFRLPAASVNVQETSFLSNAKSGPLVIHIQDIHENAEAQKNISDTLQALIRDRRVDAVALEGAFDAIHLNNFRSFEYAASRRVAADFLLKTREISGAVHAGLVADGKIPVFVGIDDKSHYDANVQAYRDAVSSQKSVLKTIAADEARLAQSKKSAFNADLARFDAGVQRYRKDLTSFGDHLRFLVKATGEAPLQVETFLAALDIESHQDLRRVEREKADLLARVVPTLNKQELEAFTRLSLSYRDQDIGAAKFFAAFKNLCASKNVSLAIYPQLDNYIRYLMLADGVQGAALYAEMNRLEQAGYAALAKSAAEKQLVAQSSRLYLTGKLVNFTLTSDEWNEYKLGVLSKNLRTNKLRTENFEKFYKEAEVRDHKMAENLKNVLSDHSVVVLVTGGFHTSGIDGALRKAGIGLVNVTPKITSIDDESGSRYLSVFTQKEEPLAKLFEGRKLFLAKAPASPLAFVKGACAMASDAIQNAKAETTIARAYVRHWFWYRMGVALDPIKVNFDGTLTGRVAEHPGSFMAFRASVRNDSTGLPGSVSLSRASSNSFLRRTVTVPFFSGEFFKLPGYVFLLLTGAIIAEKIYGTVALPPLAWILVGSMVFAGWDHRKNTRRGFAGFIDFTVRAAATFAILTSAALLVGALDIDGMTITRAELFSNFRVNARFALVFPLAALFHGFSFNLFAPAHWQLVANVPKEGDSDPERPILPDNPVTASPTAGSTREGGGETVVPTNRVPMSALEISQSTIQFDEKTHQPKQIGNYVVGQQIGQGGMGIIYMAQRKDLTRAQHARKVAIKTLNFQNSEIPGDKLLQLRQMMAIEAEMLDSVEHEAVLRIREYNVSEEIPYIVMEHVDGDSLKSYALDGKIGKKRLTLDQVLEIFISVADGLQAVHERALIHRDIKPGNIMIQANGKPKIIDFGLAMDSDALGISPNMAGSPAYMSPEQTIPGAAVGYNSDVFSLGVTLYEVLTGERPFAKEDESSIAKIFKAIQSDRHPNPRQFAPELPVKLVAAIDRALAKKANERFATAKEFADALREVKADREKAAARARWWSDLGAVVWAHKFFIAGALLVCVLIYAVWSGLGSKPNANSNPGQTQTVQKSQKEKTPEELRAAAFVKRQAEIRKDSIEGGDTYDPLRQVVDFTDMSLSRSLRMRTSNRPYMWTRRIPFNSEHIFDETMKQNEEKYLDVSFICKNDRKFEDKFKIPDSIVFDFGYTYYDETFVSSQDMRMSRDFGAGFLIRRPVDAEDGSQDGMAVPLKLVEEKGVKRLKLDEENAFSVRFGVWRTSKTNYTIRFFIPINKIFKNVMPPPKYPSGNVLDHKFIVEKSFSVAIDGYSFPEIEIDPEEIPPARFPATGESFLPFSASAVVKPDPDLVPPFKRGTIPQEFKTRDEWGWPTENGPPEYGTYEDMIPPENMSEELKNKLKKTQEKPAQAPNEVKKGGMLFLPLEGYPGMFLNPVFALGFLISMMKNRRRGLVPATDPLARFVAHVIRTARAGQHKTVAEDLDRLSNVVDLGLREFGNPAIQPKRFADHVFNARELKKGVGDADVSIPSIHQLIVVPQAQASTEEIIAEVIRAERTAQRAVAGRSIPVVRLLLTDDQGQHRTEIVQALHSRVEALTQSELPRAEEARLKLFAGADGKLAASFVSCEEGFDMPPSVLQVLQQIKNDPQYADLVRLIFPSSMSSVLLLKPLSYLFELLEFRNKVLTYA